MSTQKRAAPISDDEFCKPWALILSLGVISVLVAWLCMIISHMSVPL